MNNKWLSSCIYVTVISIAALSMGHYFTCQFYINPAAWELYVQSRGKLPDIEHQACVEVGTRTLAGLTSVLATLLALNSTPSN